MKKLLIALTLISLSACSATTGFQRMASGEIGCPPEIIKISNENSQWVLDGLRTYQAECNGVAHFCSFSNKDFGSLRCKERTVKY